MKEKRILVLSEDDLRSIVSEMTMQVVQEIRRPSEHNDMDDIMYVSDIAEMIGIDRRNLHSSQKYYLPFDRPYITGKRGEKGWKRRDVLEHLARRDSDIKKSYQEFCEKSARDEYESNSAIYSAKAMMAETKSDGASNTSAPSQP